MKVKAPFAVSIYRIMLARHMRIAWQFRALQIGWYQIVDVIHRETRG